MEYSQEFLVYKLKHSKIVLHIAPISSFTSGTKIELNLLQNRSLDLPPIYTDDRDWNHRYNFDGFLTYITFKETVCRAYAQLFRNGAIEAVEVLMLSYHGKKKLIPSVRYEEELIKALHGYLKLHKNLELNPPSIIMLSLLGVKGYEMSFQLWHSRGQPIDRDMLLIPEIVVEDYASKASDILRPAFDAIWQACGWDRSQCYDTQGNWVGDIR